MSTTATGKQDQPRLASAPQTAGMIDADVHNTLASDDLLLPYLPSRWARYVETFGLRRPDSMPVAASAQRQESMPGLVIGPYRAESYPVSVDDGNVVVEIGP